MAIKSLSMMGALVVLSSVLALGIVSEASAQSICAKHETIIEKLKTVFEEQPTGAGLSSSGGMMEIYASPNGTWTIVLTRPDGLSCLLATGKYWETMSPEIAELES